MTEPFLSPYNRNLPGAPVDNIPAGEWYRDDNLFAHLATATPLGLLHSLKEIRSVPGIWAHASSFYQLWHGRGVDNNPLNQLREEAISSWRGLLALVALSESSKLPVRLHSIHPSENKQFLLDALACCPRSLFENADSSSQNGGFTDRLGFVLYADSPDGRYRAAGLLTPATLVLPAREFSAPDHPRLTWARADSEEYNDYNFPLSDPAKSDRLRPKQRAALKAMVRRWLTRAESSDAQTSGTKKPNFALVEQLSDFLDDLEQSGQADQWIYDVSKRLSPGVGPAFQHQPLSFLNETPVHNVDREAEDTTDYRLILRSDKGISPQNVLIFANSFRGDLLEDGSREPVIWRDLTVSETSEEIIRDDLAGGNNPLENGWALFTTDDIFEPVLIEIDENLYGESINYFLHRPLGNYLLPLRPEALLIIPPSELPSKVSIKDEDGGVVVALSISVATAMGPPRTRVISKKYSADRIIRKNVKAAALALWPNFEASDWRHYFLFSESNSQSFEVLGAVTEKWIVSALETFDNLRNDSAFELPPLTVSETSRNEFADLSSIKRSNQGREAILRFDSAPEALVCGADDYSGMLLVGLEHAPPLNTEQKWTIAFDYGTTNTAIAYLSANAGQRDADTLPLSDRTLLPHTAKETGQKEKKAEVSNARYNFIAAEKIEPPFLTLLRERSTKGTDQQAIAGRHAIAYATDLDWLDHLSDNPSRYRFGEKWAPDRTSTVNAFLSQAAIQAAAEARTRGVPLENISWRFTMPAALSDTVAQSYQTIARQSVDNLYSLKRRQNPSVNFPLESSAALSYMQNIATNAVGLTHVVLDVGGHSTDVAIFSAGGNRSLWEGSFEIGGRDILIEDWIAKEARWEDACNLLLEESESDGFDDTKRSALSNKNTQRIALEMMINKIGIRPSNSKGQSTADSTEKLLLRVDQRADFVFYALCDYVARVVKSLENKEEHIDAQIGLNFCGRGSLLLQRAFQPFGLEKDVNQVEKKARRERFENFAKSTQKAHASAAILSEVSFSKKQHKKLEVALGAAALKSVLPVDSALGRHPMPQGETLELVFEDAERSKETLSPLEGIEKSVAKEGVKQFLTPRQNGAQDLPEFRGFLKRYTESVEQSPSEDSEIKISAEDLPLVISTAAFSKIGTELQDAAQADSPNGYFQPIFMAAVRASIYSWDSFIGRDE